MKTKLTIIILGLLLASALIYAGGYEVPLSKGHADTLYCRVNSICQIASLTVDNLTIINGTMTIINVTLINYNVTGEINVDGNITVDSIFANFYNWIILNDVSRKWLFFNGTDLGYNRTTLQTEFYNKSEVDDLVSSTAFDFFFTNDTSDLDGMFNFTEIDTGRAENFLQSAVITTGTNSIFNFSTIQGEPEFNELRNGIYDVHVHMFVTTSGKKDVTITPRLYNISADGLNRNLLITFESAPISILSRPLDLHGTLSETVMLGTDARLMMELVAEVGVGGGDPTVQIDMEGTTDSHFTLQTSTQAFEKIFLRLDGLNSPTGDIDWNNKNLVNVNNVGIGTTNPTSELHIPTGTANVSSLVTNNISCPDGTCEINSDITTNLDVRIDDLYVGGGVNGNSNINFYAGGSETGARIQWNSVLSRFELSNALDVFGTLSATSISSLGIITGSSDIRTTGAGDDLWLGSSIQGSAKFRANATGNVQVENITFGSGNTFIDGTNNKISINGNPVITNNSDANLGSINTSTTTSITAHIQNLSVSSLELLDDPGCDDDTKWNDEEQGQWSVNSGGNSLCQKTIGGQRGMNETNPFIVEIGACYLIAFDASNMISPGVTMSLGGDSFTTDVTGNHEDILCAITNSSFNIKTNRVNINKISIKKVGKIVFGEAVGRNLTLIEGIKIGGNAQIDGNSRVENNLSVGGVTSVTGLDIDTGTVRIIGTGTNTPEEQAPAVLDVQGGQGGEGDTNVAGKGADASIVGGPGGQSDTEQPGAQNGPGGDVNISGGPPGEGVDDPNVYGDVRFAQDGGIVLIRKQFPYNTNDVLQVNGSTLLDGKLNVTGPNATFEQDVTIKGTLHGGSPVKIAGGLIVDGGNVNISPNYNFTSGYYTILNDVGSYFNELLITAKGAIRYMDNDETVDVMFLNVTSGYVGIGTITPDTAFHIKADVPGVVGSTFAGQLIIQNPADDNKSNVVITAYESDGSGNPDQQLWYLGSSSSSTEDIILLNRRNAKLHLGTSGSTRMTILSNGSVGIGTMNPTAKLHIYTLTGGEDLLFLRDQINTADLTIDSPTGALMEIRAGVNDHLQLSSGATANQGIRIRNDGNVGIGTTTPSQKLVVVGKTNITDTLIIGSPSSIENITMFTNPSGNPACCGVLDDFSFKCTAGACV